MASLWQSDPYSCPSLHFRLSWQLAAELLILHPSYSAHIVSILNDHDILLDSYCIIEYSIILDKQLVLIAQEEVTDLSSGLPEGRCVDPITRFII